MSTFFFYSGVAAWLAFGSVGSFLALDWVIDQIVDSFKLKREFLAFVWGRLKRKSASTKAGGE